jgi:hypothetical protein
MTFPQLKTGAVMQYPGSRTHNCSTNVAQFLDGSEQRFREWRKPRRRWVVRLDILDDTEISKLEEFFLAVRGATSEFEFVDPFDGIVYSHCSFEDQVMCMSWSSFGSGEARLIVRQSGS